MNIDLIWPVLEKKNSKSGRASAPRPKNAVYLSSQSQLEEARRIYDREIDRRKTADSKASTYLAVSISILSIIITLAPIIYSIITPSKYHIIASPFLFMAIGSLIRIAYYSKKTLKISNFSLLWIDDLSVTSFNSRNVNLNIYRKIIKCIDSNKDNINDKVTNIRMIDALLSSFMVNSVIFCLSMALISYFLAIYADGETIIICARCNEFA
ncbi:hypothetical protein [Salinivibrio sp. KP-1]|uniref:hypothetical protein n=1 Tax=Salinivibrio sp. KP-1 TaxID=1406902 RepID=UPI00061453AA|nr:hypothetical protein [Salinivibrio sp. KP-1]KKA43420.1 hypothetical protein WN56_13610 [Salinivibrio sp. KP-1]